MSTRTYLELAAAVILAAAFAWFVHHERTVGAEHIAQSDAKALQAAQRQADAESALNLERAAKASAGAINAQKSVDAFAAAHPLPSIGLCVPNHSGPAVPEARPGAAGAAGAVEPVAATPVPAGGDIEPAIDTILRVAERLAIQNGQWQQR